MSDDEIRDDLWDFIAPYASNSLALMAINDRCRAAAERFPQKGDPYLGVRREAIKIIVEPTLPDTFPAAKSAFPPQRETAPSYADRREEILYVETCDFERLFRMLWWMQKSEVAVHLYTEKKWIQKEKHSKRSMIDTASPALRSNYHVVWTMLDGLFKGGFAALRLSFNRPLESNDEDYVRPPIAMEE